MNIPGEKERKRDREERLSQRGGTQREAEEGVEDRPELQTSTDLLASLVPSL